MQLQNELKTQLLLEPSLWRGWSEGGSEADVMELFQTFLLAADTQAQDELKNGRLLFPREDCFYVEAFVKWAITVVEELRVACRQMLMTDTVSEAVCDPICAAISKAVDSLRAALERQPVMAATRWLLGNVQDGDGEGLSITKQGRLADIVYARLLFEKLTLENKMIGFMDDVTCEAAVKVSNSMCYLRYCFVMAFAAMGAIGSQLDSSIGEQNSEARAIVENEPLLHGVLDAAVLALHEYHVAIFNLYFVAAIGRQLDGAKHSMVREAVSELERQLKAYAALHAPTVRTLRPMPLSPLAPCYIMP